MKSATLTIDNRKDILLLLLLSPGRSQMKNEPISGRTRLIKLVYLFYEELAYHLPTFKKIAEHNRHEFIAYHFGPFSKDIYDDIQFLENADLIEEDSGDDLSIAEVSEWRLFYDDVLIDRIESQEAAGDYSVPIFKLTEKGGTFTDELYNLLQKREQIALQEFKGKYNSLPLNTLLRYIYTTYPDFTIKSKIKNFI